MQAQHLTAGRRAQPAFARRSHAPRTSAAAARARKPSADGEQGRPQGGAGDPGQQQQQQQQQSSSAWGSGWARRPTGQPGKTGSYFSRSPPAGGAGGSAQGGAAAAPAAEDVPQLDPALAASIRQNVDRAAATLQDIIDEVLKEVFIEQAAAYVMDGQQEEGQGEGQQGQQQAPEPQPDAQQLIRQAVRGAVASRLEWLDANFLAALNAYTALPGVAAHPDLAALLAALRDELLAMVGSRLPPAVQVLNAAAAHSSRAARVGVLRRSLAGGGGGLPGSTLDALGAAAGQLVDDMEEQQVVADRVLLARLVLLREELRQLALAAAAAADGGAWMAAAGTSSSSSSTANDGGPHDAVAAGEAGDGASSSSSSGSQFFSFHRSNLPSRCAALVKELLVVRERQRRLGLLQKAFEEDWIGDTSSSSSSSTPPAQQQQQPQQQRSGLRDVRQQAAAGDGGPGEAPDVVRPGGLLATLAALAAELERQVAAGPPLGGASNSPGLAALALLGQLDELRREALAALDHLQRQRPGGDGDGGDDDGLGDYEADLQEAVVPPPGPPAS